MSQTEYAIRYYRDEEWAQRCQKAGIANKPVGWHISPHHYRDRNECLRDIEHINAQRPKYPAELVVLWNGVER